MFWAGIAFLLGDLLFQQLPQLPDVYWLLILTPVAFLVFWRLSRWLIPAFLILGFAWGMFYAHLSQRSEVPDDCLYTPVDVSGRIIGIVNSDEDRIRFDFDIDHFARPSCIPDSLPIRVRASWWHKYEDLPFSGEHWTLSIKLRKTRNFYNHGGFDYEAHLLGQGIRYKASVIGGDKQVDAGWSIHSLRAILAENIEKQLADRPGGGIVRALVLGDRSQISAEQKSDLLRSGTLHLMAISGLHIGMVASLGYLFFTMIWRVRPQFSLIVPAPLAGGVGAIIIAAIYSGLAGFSLPTQRALIMLSCVMLGLLLRRKTDPGSILGLALFAVLIADPFSVNLPGFWLSFLAVALLLFGLNRTEHQSRTGAWIRVQWLLLIGMLPLSLMFFQGASIAAPVANFIAIPWVGLTVLPPALLGSALDSVGIPLGGYLLQLAALSIEWLMVVLHLIAQFPLSWLEAPGQEILYMLIAFAGVMLVLMPGGWPGRSLGVLLILPVLISQRPLAEEGRFRMDVLDVGEGLAIAVQTSRHVLVYDTGPSFGPDFNTGQAVILPWLSRQGVRHIDTLIVSHGDNDHIGGANSLLSGIGVGRVLTSVPERFERSADDCQAGMSWQWDGVEFSVLHPPGAWPFQGNNRSCVLLVRNSRYSVLITGDIESISEFRLRKDFPDLRVDVLVIPHHGSRTSSTLEFIRHLQPDYALVSTGYRNRFGFPRAEVLERYRQQGIPVYDTAEEGTITLLLPETGVLETPVAYLDGHRRYWYSAPYSRTDGP